MNFYERRLNILSNRNHKLVQRLNQLHSKVIDEVSEQFFGEKFFLTKRKGFARSGELELICEKFCVGEKHGKQIEMIRSRYE
jgi:hypothetical protein